MKHGEIKEWRIGEKEQIHSLEMKENYANERDTENAESRHNKKRENDRKEREAKTKGMSHKSEWINEDEAKFHTVYEERKTREKKIPQWVTVKRKK